MVKYIENVNAYITQMKIKQTYISLKSGINTSTLSRILNGSREVSISEMEKISSALGEKVEYFLNENFSVPEIPKAISNSIVFYAGEPSKEQEQFAMQLLELFENVDEVLSAKGRFMNVIGE
ncbi:MAG: helix-turn-helix transcriptional regulator [Roseburia sp.]|nr:helix-turn-helix transcriptional regulator [Roseburia sp.]